MTGQITLTAQRIRSVTLVVVIVMTALGAAACLPIPRLGEKPQEKCSREFFLWSNDAPLGPSADFFRVADELAATAGITTSLDDIARRAGWSPSGRWDRLIYIAMSSDSSVLNAAAGTTNICYRGFSTSDPDRGSDGYYVFFNGPNPVQTAGAGSQPVIAPDEIAALGRDETLYSDTSIKRPVLRRVIAGGQ